METTAIHLTTSESFQKEAPINQSERIVDAFIESCKALDASIFEPFMEENNVFETKNKYLFLASLKALFDTFKNDKPLSIDIVVNDGICNGCKYSKSVKIFSVNVPVNPPTKSIVSLVPLAAEGLYSPNTAPLDLICNP